MTAIHKVLDGDIYVSDKLASKLLRRVAGDREQSDGSPLAKLSDRELEVFEMLGQGKGVRQIAQMLHISPKTVGAHREHIKAKLNLGGTAELLRYAIQSQLQPEATE